MPQPRLLSRIDRLLNRHLGGAAPSAAPAPVADSSQFCAWTAVGATAIFLFYGLAHIQADFWFDEWLTVLQYASYDRLYQVLTTYDQANNHILFSVVQRAWFQVFGYGSEGLARLPSVFMAVLTLMLCYHQGRRLFGRASAGMLLLLLMAFSPVYIGFFSQLRGYSMTILLSTLATFGALHLVRGQPRTGAFMFCLGALPLPGVLPSNALVTVSLFVFLNLALTRTRQWRRRWPYLLVCALALAGGGAIYLPIHDQFIQVLQQTRGWPAGWRVAAHWLLALVAHLGFFVTACIALRRKAQAGTDPDEDAAAAQAQLRPLLLLLAACCLLPLLGAALVQAPFPRALLGYLPPLTLAGMYVYDHAALRRNQYCYLLVFFVLTNFLCWTRMAHYRMEIARSRGVHRQNLLQQYYARSRDVSRTVNWLRYQQQLPVNVKIFVDFHYYVATRRYWGLTGAPMQAVECLNAPPGSEAFALKLPRAVYARLPVVILTYAPEAARAAYRDCTGVEIDLRPLPAPSQLGIFQVVQTPTAPPAPPDDGNRVQPLWQEPEGKPL